MSDTAKDLELFHAGVKGMKWGVRRKPGADGTVSGGSARRKKTPEPTNPDYGSHKQRMDKIAYGKGGVKRINKRLNKGDDYQTARKKEGRAQIATYLSIGTAAVLVNDPAFRRGVKHVAKSAATGIGKAAVNRAMSSSGKTPTIQLKFDSKNNLWK